MAKRAESQPATPVVNEPRNLINLVKIDAESPASITEQTATDKIRSKSVSFANQPRHFASLTNVSNDENSAKKSSKTGVSNNTEKVKFYIPLKQVLVDGLLPENLANLLFYLENEAPSVAIPFQPMKERVHRVRHHLKHFMKNGNRIDWGMSCDVYDACSVLKNFLRHLPSPLMALDGNQSSIAQWKDAIKPVTRERQRIQMLKDLLQKLPFENKTVLRHILHLLRAVSDNSEVTLTSSLQGAAAFAAYIFTRPKSSKVVATKTKYTILLRYMLDHLDELKPPLLLPGYGTCLQSNAVVGDRILACACDDCVSKHLPARKARSAYTATSWSSHSTSPVQPT